MLVGNPKQNPTRQSIFIADQVQPNDRCSDHAVSYHVSIRYDPINKKFQQKPP
jgi:hypothetical protein